MTSISSPTTKPTQATITVIGLGPMGQAMTRSFLEAGHRVTVWNRTPSRADQLVKIGARHVATPAEAVRASELLVLSLTDYRAMWQILDGTAEDLAGRTIVNLSSDTPDKSREAAAWAASHGASFLTGGVMVPPPMVGTDLAYIYYSGAQSVFEAHKDALGQIGEPRYLGVDPRLAQIMYQAHLDLFLTALAGFAHATALAGSAGIPAQTFLPEAMRLFTAIPAMIANDGADVLGAQIDADDHPGERSSNIMMGATADHIVETSAAAGVDITLPRAVQSLYRRAINEGHGSEGWTRTVDIIRKPQPSS